MLDNIGTIYGKNKHLAKLIYFSFRQNKLRWLCFTVAFRKFNQNTTTAQSFVFFLLPYPFYHSFIASFPSFCAMKLLQKILHNTHTLKISTSLDKILTMKNSHFIVLVQRISNFPDSQHYNTETLTSLSNYSLLPLS